MERCLFLASPKTNAETEVILNSDPRKHKLGNGKSKKKLPQRIEHH